MSIQWINYVLDHSESKGSARLVLIIIAEHANIFGIAWPSINRIAEKANIDRTNVIRHIKNLKKLGELTVVGRDRSGTNKFQLLLGQSPTRPDHISPSHGDKNTPVSECEIANPLGAISHQQKCGTAPQTFNEPPLEPLSIVDNGVPAETPSEPEIAFMSWNSMAKRAGLSTIKLVEKTRTKKAEELLKKIGGLDQWNLALNMVETNSFLCGAGEKGWKITIDKMLDQHFFACLIEGGYDRFSPNRPDQSQYTPRRVSMTEAALRVAKRGSASKNVTHGRPEYDFAEAFFRKLAE
ncbi:helix-turn-helix domain-containing protein [Thalassospiraceae bacterium LMO-SO8]|nr:helix-turn-helix domain-containing protein [Alphaproteobacteria bacterium LMO-S08]WND76661.1 helix-turn-helix domain-containing protein [Thalassospiraceae bacterium LMO-SO8]